MKPFDYTKEFFSSVYAWIRLIRKWSRLGVSITLPDRTLEWWETCEKNSPYTLGKIWDFAEGIKK